MQTCPDCEDVKETVVLPSNRPIRALSDDTEFSLRGPTANDDHLCKLKAMFPGIEEKVLSRQLRRAGNDIDMAVRLLTKANHKLPAGWG